MRIARHYSRVVRNLRQTQRVGVIRTVTLNTGFDEIYVASDLRWGGVEPLLSYRSDPSGKGINMARTLRWLASSVHAYALVGSDDAELFAAGLDRDGIAHTVREVPGPTRRNLTVRNESAHAPAAHVVGPGFELADDSPVQELFDAVLADLQPGDLVTLNGSLPTGLPIDTWGRLVSRVGQMGVPIILDNQAEPLRSALRACRPLAAIPNIYEARDLFHETAMSPREALYALATAGVQLPVVTAGELGALALVDGAVWNFRLDLPDPHILVGAGDAFAAGLTAALMQRPEDRRAALRRATATAAAHVTGARGITLRNQANVLLNSVVEHEQG